MNNIQLESLKEGLTFTEDILIDNNVLLIPRSVSISKELLNALTEWEFHTFNSNGDLSLGGDIGIDKKTDEQPEQTEKIGESLKNAIIESQKNNKDIVNSDANRMNGVQKVYDEYINFIDYVFTHYATHKAINQEELSDTVKELCIFIKENRRFILRINSSSGETKHNYIVIHCMRTTVLALSIGLQLHMTLSKMIELGEACIIHEIGMLRLPPQLYMKTKPLTSGERIQIKKHSVFGYSIAKELKFPLTIQLAILEHHEKENGTGYPRKLTSDKISTYAKIISVACSYEAITSERNYKKERSSFEAIVEILQNQNRQYDDVIVKALLYSVSLYPIGTYVYLKNRKIAIVTDNNPENPKLPVVQLLMEKEKDGSPITIQTNDNELSIVRVLSNSERIDMISLQEEKYKSIEEARKQALEEHKKNETSTNPKPETTEKLATESNSTIENVDISAFD